MLSLIVAFSKNRVIGKEGKIPWKIKGEQIRFKELTMGNAIVMGRKTFEEIGKPLEGRKTYLLSSQKNTIGEERDLIQVSSLKEVLELEKEKEIFVSGGARLYQEAVDLVEYMYITEVEGEYEGDTFFPEYNEEEWITVYKERFDGEVPYNYLTLQRQKKLL